MILGVSRLKIYIIFTNDRAQDVHSHVNAFGCERSRYLCPYVQPCAVFHMVPQRRRSF